MSYFYSRNRTRPLTWPVSVSTFPVGAEWGEGGWSETRHQKQTSPLIPSSLWSPVKHDPGTGMVRRLRRQKGFLFGFWVLGFRDILWVLVFVDMEIKEQDE